MVCSARFNCRSPERFRRWRVTCPEDAGIGLTPARAAKAASERSRPAWDQLTRIWAPLIGPTRAAPTATARPRPPAAPARLPARRPRRPAAGCAGRSSAGPEPSWGAPATLPAGPAARHSEAQLQHRYGHRAATVLNGHRAKLLLSGQADPAIIAQARASHGARSASSGRCLDARTQRRTPAGEGLERTIQLGEVLMADRHSVTGRSALGLGVGRIQQRHATLDPQPLDLIKVLSDIGGFLRRDAPTMGQPHATLPCRWPGYPDGRGHAGGAAGAWRGWRQHAGTTPRPTT
jgi:hypothetical protein